MLFQKRTNLLAMTRLIMKSDQKNFGIQFLTHTHTHTHTHTRTHKHRHTHLHAQQTGVNFQRFVFYIDWRLQFMFCMLKQDWQSSYSLIL